MSQLVILSVTTGKHVTTHGHHHGVRVPAGLHSTVTTAEPPNISVPSLAGIYWSRSCHARACHQRHISTSTASCLPPPGCVEILRRNHEHGCTKLGSVCTSAAAGATPGRAQAIRQRPLPCTTHHPRPSPRPSGGSFCRRPPPSQRYRALLYLNNMREIFLNLPTPSRALNIYNAIVQLCSSHGTQTSTIMDPDTPWPSAATL